ncbi:MAG: hypothetical protein ACOCZ8_01285 [Bacteroidota bacterium]
MPKFFQLKAGDDQAKHPVQWPGWFLRYYNGNGNTYHRFRSPNVNYDGPLTDLLYCEEGWLLGSAKLRDTLKAHKLDEEVVHFHPVEVHAGDQTETYFLIHFPYRRPAYKWARWQYDDEHNFIKQPPLDEDIVEDWRVFCPFHRHKGYAHVVVIHEKVKSALEQAALTGLAFEKQHVDD